MTASGRDPPASTDAVWRGMTREQIAFQYNPQLAVPDAARYARENREASARARAALPAVFDVRYGAGPRQLLDIFPAAGAAGPAPVLVFVHGGGWRALDRSVYAFLAGPWSALGAVTVLPGYGLLPEVPLARMIEEIREAIDWIASHAVEHGGDPSHIVLAGMSAGAHLAAMALADPERARRVRAAALASATYDLEAHRWHGRHADMALDEALVERASPLRNLPSRADLPMVLAVGADETPEMIRQSRDYRAALAARGQPVELVVEPGRHHLNMGRVFADPETRTFEQLRRLLFPLPAPFRRNSA